ncbi:hypothetical protein GUY61_15520 [Streptomyces sp. GC420]|nr:hypothetical protein [Streptomyces sp. GC420]
MHPPAPLGGRRVTVDGEVIGLAHSLKELTEFLREAGIGLTEEELATSPLIEWRGGGPYEWSAV